MKTFKQIREKYSVNEGLDVRRSKNFDNYNRKGHEARLYDLEKTSVEDIDNAIKKSRGKAHISSFDGSSSKPKDFEIMGDMKTLQQISKLLKQGKVQKNPYK